MQRWYAILFSLIMLLVAIPAHAQLSPQLCDVTSGGQICVYVPLLDQPVTDLHPYLPTIIVGVHPYVLVDEQSQARDTDRGIDIGLMQAWRPQPNAAQANEPLRVETSLTRYSADTTAIAGFFADRANYLTLGFHITDEQPDKVSFVYNETIDGTAIRRYRCLWRVSQHVLSAETAGLTTTATPDRAAIYCDTIAWNLHVYRLD